MNSRKRSKPLSLWNLDRQSDLVGETVASTSPPQQNILSRTFELVAYSCPIGKYPSPLTPIVKTDDDVHAAIYLKIDNGVIEIDEEYVEWNSNFVKLSPTLKEQLKNFNCCKDRLFAVAEEDFRYYEVKDEVAFFTGLLADKSFSYDDPFIRRSLAEFIGDEDSIEIEKDKCDRYLNELRSSTVENNDHIDELEDTLSVPTPTETLKTPNKVRSNNPIPPKEKICLPWGIAA